MESMNMKRILCIGSVTADVIIKPADSLPASGTLRAVESISTHMGGCACNMAAALGVLGTPVTVCCKVGSDAMGDLVKKTLKGYGVDTAGVVTSDSVSTTVSAVLVSSKGERSFLYYPGSAARFTDADVPDALIDQADVVFIAGAMLLSDFDGEPAARLMKKAKEKGKFTGMDTAWDFDGRWLPKVAPTLPYLDLFMPSIDEAAMLTGEQEPEKITEKLRSLGCTNVMLKAGSRGAYVAMCGEEPYWVPQFWIEKVLDTTGAGDSACAGFFAGFARGLPTRACAELAMTVGALAVSAVGATTGILPYEDTIQLMENRKKGL